MGRSFALSLSLMFALGCQVPGGGQSVGQDGEVRDSDAESEDGDGIDLPGARSSHRAAPNQRGVEPTAAGETPAPRPDPILSAASVTDGPLLRQHKPGTPIEGRTQTPLAQLLAELAAFPTNTPSKIGGVGEFPSQAGRYYDLERQCTPLVVSGDPSTGGASIICKPIGERKIINEKFMEVMRAMKQSILKKDRHLHRYCYGESKMRTATCREEVRKYLNFQLDKRAQEIRKNYPTGSTLYGRFKVQGFYRWHLMHITKDEMRRWWGYYSAPKDVQRAMRNRGHCTEIEAKYGNWSLMTLNFINQQCQYPL